MSILIAILALALLIVLHEAGHFFVARLCGMRVERFSIGFGNAIASFKRGDTVYQIAPVPLGGYVQITGMNPHEDYDRNDPYVYPNRPRWMRFMVLAAGPLANYVTAVLVSMVVFLGWGVPTGTTKVDEIIPGSAAEQAGLKVGDQLSEVNGTKVEKPAAITQVVRGSEGAALNFKVTRGNSTETLSIAPRKDATSGVYVIGVRFGQVRQPAPIGPTIKEAFVWPYAVSTMLVGNIRDMITRKAKGSLTGPLGIASEMAKAAKQGAQEFLDLVILISCALAVFNLLPVPALDGGRILFLGIATAVRRELNARVEATVHMVGMGLLLILLAFVTYGDIKNQIVKLFG
jgi:regulator of sigma E protease